MIVFGSLGDFAALGFAAQSLITPVGGVTMVGRLRKELPPLLCLTDLFPLTGCQCILCSFLAQGSTEQEGEKH